MTDREKEYLEMFRAEAHENHEDLNRLLAELENNFENKNCIDSIFRIVHTLKGNAMGLGIKPIAELGHVMEDVFGGVKNRTIELNTELFNSLFKANDKLGDLIVALKTGENVRYKGIATKLKVVLRRSMESIDKVEVNKVVVEKVIDEVPSSSASLESKESVTISDELTLEPAFEEALASKVVFSDHVNVPVKKLDELLNIVGELMIEKDSLNEQLSSTDNSIDFTRLHRITADLQYGIMGTRLIPIGFMFNKFQRIIRDVATIEKKDVELQLEGTEIEIDRNILKVLSDSLVHLIRNAVSHGIEDKEERIQSQKTKLGNVTLKAFNEKEVVVIQVIDDGKGIDHHSIVRKAIAKQMITPQQGERMVKEEILQLIFEPGFSNADVITEVSGRGVGMDVVKRAVESVGGNVAVETTLGKGTQITLEVPSSLALKGALLFEVENFKYAIPLSYTEAVLSIKRSDLLVVNDRLLFNYMNKSINILFMCDVFNNVSNEAIKNCSLKDQLNVIIVSYQNYKVGLVVDRLLQQKEIIEKSLSSPLDNLVLFSGATILGDGNVCLVLNTPGVIKKSFV